MRILIIFFAICTLFSCQKMTEVEEHYGSKLDGELVPGYSYINHTKKAGTKAKAGDFVYFNYYILNKDSLLFSNADGEAPDKMPLPADGEEVQAQLLPMHNAFKQMSVGDSLSMFIHIDSFPSKPKDLGETKYITQTFILKDIKDAAAYNADLQAEKAEKMALLEVAKKRESEVAEKVSLTAKQYTSGKLDSKMKKTASGLKYIVHEEGIGPKPTQGSNVLVQYYGALTDGTPFDNSFKRGTPFNFPLGMGRVIKGWDEGIALLNTGSAATFFIPSHLAYGEAGAPPTIPAKSELIFYVELESFTAK